MGRQREREGGRRGGRQKGREGGREGERESWAAHGKAHSSKAITTAMNMCHRRSTTCRPFQFRFPASHARSGRSCDPPRRGQAILRTGGACIWACNFRYRLLVSVLTLLQFLPLPDFHPGGCPLRGEWHRACRKSERCCPLVETGPGSVEDAAQNGDCGRRKRAKKGKRVRVPLCCCA
eukprot:3107779-Rhodomonas_salina.2